jgi:hypothetical protein
LINVFSKPRLALLLGVDSLSDLKEALSARMTTLRVSSSRGCGLTYVSGSKKISTLHPSIKVAWAEEDQMR